MAPPTGLEPVTSWLTVKRSTDWAKEEYVFPTWNRKLFVGNFSFVSTATRSTDWAKEEYLPSLHFMQGKQRYAKKHTAVLFQFSVGIIYLPGPSPAKYFRRERA